MYTLERHSSFPSRKKTMFRFELNFTTCVRAYLPLPRHSCAEVTAAAPADGRPAAALAELRTCGSVARDGLWIRAIHTVGWQCRGAGCSVHLMAARWRPARARTHLAQGGLMAARQQRWQSFAPAGRSRATVYGSGPYTPSAGNVGAPAAPCI
jgi:hypothetical protein